MLIPVNGPPKTLYDMAMIALENTTSIVIDDEDDGVGVDQTCLDTVANDFREAGWEVGFYPHKFILDQYAWHNGRNWTAIEVKHARCSLEKCAYGLCSGLFVPRNKFANLWMADKAGFNHTILVYFVGNIRYYLTADLLWNYCVETNHPDSNVDAAKLKKEGKFSLPIDKLPADGIKQFLYKISR